MANEKILVIDNESTHQMPLSQSLKSAGYQVVTVIDRENAWERLEAEAFDLILLNLKVPERDGMDLLQSIVEWHPEIQVVIISAHATVKEAVEAMKLGAADFIQQPVEYIQNSASPQEIQEVVHNALHAHQNAGSDYDRLLTKARQFASQYQLVQAMNYVKRAIGADPSRPEALTLLGELEEVAGDRLEALKKYRAAIDLDPTYQPAQQALDRATTDAHRKPRFTYILRQG